MSVFDIVPGVCPKCGEATEGFASGRDWWHTEATTCPARLDGSTFNQIVG